MTAFDLLIRGGTLVDGTGSPGVPADVGMTGDRIAAVGDLSAVAAGDVRQEIDAKGRVVCPGFIDPHGHSDVSLFVDGALASHLRQGFTTQLSGNCGSTVAPITPLGRELVELELRVHRVTARWRASPSTSTRSSRSASGRTSRSSRVTGRFAAPCSAPRRARLHRTSSR